MARSTCEELLEEFRRPGIRTYREANELLQTCGFRERRTDKGHAVWVHPRGSIVTLTKERELKTYLKKQVERAIEKLQLLDE